MSTSSTFVVGVIEAPAVAQALESAGIRVITGPEFRQSVRAIIAEQQRLEASGADPFFPLVIADVARPGIRSYAQKESVLRPVAILRVEPSGGIPVTPTLIDFDLPGDIAALGAEIGFPANLVPSTPIDVDGTVVVASAPPTPKRWTQQAPRPVPEQTTVPGAVEDGPVPPRMPAWATANPPANEPESVSAADPRPSTGLQDGGYPDPFPHPVPETESDEWEWGADDLPGFAPTAETPTAPNRMDHAAQAWHEYERWRAHSQTASEETPRTPYQPPQPSPMPEMARPTPGEWPPSTAESPTQYPTHQERWPTAPRTSTQPRTGQDLPHRAQTPLAVTPTSDVIPSSVDDLFARAQHGRPSLATTHAKRTGECELAVVASGKGGVGKGSIAVALAQRAGEVRPQTHSGDEFVVTVIDLNRGQGDQRKYLRLQNAGLPSVMDAALTGDPRRAMISRAELNAARHRDLPPLSFNLVLAPPNDEANPALITPEVYRDVIAFARSVSDLVILDTQTAELVDVSGLFDGVVRPLLRHGAWCLAITDFTTAGVDNTVEFIKSLLGDSIPRDKVLSAINDNKGQNSFADSDIALFASYFNASSTFLGVGGYSPDFSNAMHAGSVAADDPAVAPLLDSVLHRITGLPEFQPQAELPRRRFFRFGGRR